MAKICFYCGKELTAGERCGCRTTDSGNTDNPTSSASADSKNSKRNNTDDRAKKAREEQSKRAKEQAGYYRQTNKKARTKFNWQTFLLRLMTTSGYESNDKLPRKIGYSILQSLLRPVTAIDTFVQRQDFSLSIFYLVLFSLTAGLAVCRFYGFSLLMFIEGSLLGAAIALILNGLFILVLRFLSRMRFSFRQILSAFSCPAIFFSIFFLFAATGRSSIISFVLTMIAGVTVGAIFHFLAIKSLTRQTTEQVAVNVALVYVVFYSIVGIILNLVSPVLII